MHSIALAALLLPALVQATSYNQVKEFVGEQFFDDWNFYNNIDNLTNGNVFYAGFQEASQDKLAFVNGAGNAIMKVDNTTKLTFGQNRNSVRIVSKQQFTVGSVFIADMLHIPYGCSVWPAWWSSAVEWPQGGEIDFMEGVNGETQSHMGLHTSPGCTHTNTSLQTSTLINSTDCSTLANNNEGCITTNPSQQSYGEDFANNGGGVFVTEFATTGIAMWFFPRSSIPSSLQGNASALDTSTLGTPVANYSSDGCAITTFFDTQQLVFDISLCGDYAGNAQIFQQTCTGVCYDDWVAGDASNYDTAYFEVQYVRVYGLPGELTVIGNGARRPAEIAGVLTLLAGAAVALILAF